MKDLDRLQLGRQIYKPHYKTDNAATFEATYDGQPVIAKRGDEHLRREAGILQAVERANNGIATGIPKCIAYLEDTKQNHFLVMERLPGMPLIELIGLSEEWESRPLPPAEATRITDGLATCFAALHRADYLYRDLILGHILVDHARISLVDCEWSVLMDPKTHIAQVDNRAGTWETMAPEEFEVGNIMTPTSNTYTLGIVLLQLLTGRNPFYITKESIPDADQRRHATQQLQQTLPKIATRNPSFDQIIIQALQPEPARRYQTVADFQQALEVMKT